MQGLVLLGFAVLRGSGEVTTSSWSSSNALTTSKGVVELEEHVASFGDGLVDMGREVVSEVLWGSVGVAAGVVHDEVVGVRAVTTTYSAESDVAAFQLALSEGAIGAGAIVYVSVVATMESVLPVEALHAEGVSDEVLYKGCLDCEGGEDLTRECSYIFGDDLLLSNPVLRDLLAYAKPLILVLANEGACRLRVPATHHRVLLANDGAEAQAAASRARGVDAHTFPTGLEGITDADELVVFARAVAVARAQRDSARDLLVSASWSTIYRKPSRVALGNWVELDGGRARLVDLANSSGLGLSLASTSIAAARDQWPVGTEWSIGQPSASFDEYEMTRRSAFTLCPAGDLWMSGRILEAALLGSMPLVDATFVADGGRSAQGCHHPAYRFRI